MTARPDARQDWDRRIHERRADTVDAAPTLPAPAGLHAEPSVGHVRLSWEPVPGAVGYLIERAGSDGRGHVLDHGGSDVPAIATALFADTGIADGVRYRYRVAAVSDVGYPPSAWSEPAYAATRDGAPGTVGVTVDATTVAGSLKRVWGVVGSERLSQLNLGVDGHGHDIGAEFEKALRLAHDDLGVVHVRAHAILHDDLGVVRRATDGSLAYDFTALDNVYDRILAVGVRPVVELSFMPAVLARDPEQTVFTYRGIVSPPADWAQWRHLVQTLGRHLVDRYGIDEVSQWVFEVWNEPNLAVFWSGTQEEYLRLYDESAGALKAVDHRLRLAGPATSAAAWVESFAAHAARTGVAVDVVTTHTYGNLPVDLRPALRRHGLGDTPIWWTEWGVGHSHFADVHDAVLGAPFVLSGLLSAQDRLDALAYWVISDHFEELGRPPRLFHGGFGLLTVGNLRKPRYWAVHLAAHQGDHVLATTVEGDGAGVLVQAWATRHDDGTVDLLVWNGTVNSALAGGDARLDRDVVLTVHGLGALRYRVLLARVDQQHSNITAQCPPDVTWPEPALWTRLREHDVLDERRLPDLADHDGCARLTLPLPMPGVARLRLVPDTTAAPPHEGNAP